MAGLVKAIKERKVVKIQGISFEVFPGVFSPVYSSDTDWYAGRIVPLIKNKNFLEIGAGTGIIACLAAINGASNVVATDINPDAIENIKQNSQIHSLNLSVRMGSVFDPLQDGEKFDLIFWNHPFYFAPKESIKNDILYASFVDEEYQYLKRFFSEGRKFLNENGSLLLGTSNIARINLIKGFAKAQGFTIALLDKSTVPVYKGKKVKMDVRLYEFKI